MNEGRQLASIKEKKSTTLKTKAGKDMDVVQVVYDRLDISPSKEVTKNLPMYKLEDNPTLTEQIKSLEVGTQVCLVVDNDKWGEVVAIEDKSTAPAVGSKTVGNKTWGAGVKDHGRQNSIIFQNSLAHATALVLHNSTGEASAEEILTEAYKFYDVSRDPEKARSTVEASSSSSSEGSTGSSTETVAPVTKADFGF